MENNKKYKEAMHILGTTNIVKTFIIYISWILNPDIAIKLANKIFDNIKKQVDIRQNTIAIGYLNEFFSKYLEFGKSKEEIIKINGLIDKKIKTKDKITNALIELRRIRQRVKELSKNTEDQKFTTKNSFGVSQGIVIGTILNFKSTKQRVPDNCIGIFPTSGVKHTTQFLKCVGIVFKNGSITSHGAILAREFGIPAIVSPNINVEDNELVEINGITGIVKRVVDRVN